MGKHARKIDPAGAQTLMSKRFVRACESSPDEYHEFGLTLAGRPVGLRVVGSELAEIISRPFAHLVRDLPDADATSLTIQLWDRRVSGVPLPGGSYESDPTVHRHRESVLCYDRDGALLVGSFKSAGALSLYERGRPLHAPLAQWHNDQETPMIHAGFAAKDGKGIVFAGRPGVGKSTAAVTCAFAGFAFLSDDLIGLGTGDDGTFHGHSIYNSTYLDRAHLERFPLLAPHAIKSRYEDEDKLLVLLSHLERSAGHAPVSARLWRATPGGRRRVSTSAPVRAIALPELGEGARTTFLPESSAKALLALAPHSLGINRNLGRSGFDKLARLVESAPAFRLRLGTDLAGIPPAVEKMLKEVG